MEIERINENTIKFYISYIDIEERGFDRDEIWYNRERGEELFWEMLDEVHQEDEFVPEGPLWIQIQALDKGLEILVTKAQLSKDGNKLELPIPDDNFKDLPIDVKMEEFLDQQFHIKSFDITEVEFEYVLAFNEFEDILELAKVQKLKDVKTKLYFYEGKYYVYLQFPEELYDGDKADDDLSLLYEYGFISNLTIHRLKEYGNEILAEDVFTTIEQYF